MQLKYRGVSYDYNPPEIETTESEQVGTYRGLEWRFRNPKKPLVLETNLDFKYRGVPYRSGQTVRPEMTTAPVAATAPTPKQLQAQPAKPASKAPGRSVEEQARALMMSHHTWIKNREQSLLGRAAAEVGLDADAAKFWNHIQGKVHPTFRNNYDRSRATMS